MIVGGIDGGVSGALALYETETKRLISVRDMPIFMMPINKKMRKRVDTVTLYNWFTAAKMYGIELICIEAVGGRPRQGASAAFVFGYTIGLIFMAAIANKIHIETPSSAVWKKVMRVPGKRTPEGKTDKHAGQHIVARADELMPNDRHLWRGERDGLKVDRAEAAMIAKYAGDYLMTGPASVARKETWRQKETKEIYKEAETGA
jgi:hypothetical protein